MKISQDNLAAGDALAYLKEVKVTFQHNRIRYHQFIKVIKDWKAKKIGTRGLKARVKRLFKGHTHLILGFNIFLPKRHQFHGKTLKKVEENRELPLDLLDIIYKTVDFDYLFQFAGVCKNWRASYEIYYRNFLASHEPLLLQISYHAKESYSLVSIPDQKVDHLEMMNYFYCRCRAYVAFSSGYFIMLGYNDTVLLINPFARIKKVINTSFEFKPFYFANRALLAFGKCSEEFVLVILCTESSSLHVYQSRNCGWVTYSTTEEPRRIVDFAEEEPERIVDFVVLHNIIYVVTHKANIGVLSLNSTDIKFLKLKSTPDVRHSLFLRLVNCDEQLLVVDLMIEEIRNVYKIDLSNMNYVKLDTLGDMALFYTSTKKCYALSNPNRWGYKSNSVYVIPPASTKCSVYSGDDKKLQEYITPPAPRGTHSFLSDWCFRHRQYESRKKLEMVCSFNNQVWNNSKISAQQIGIKADQSWEECALVQGLV